tara:strand:+ start:636 stop:755 length:120 start_codon:yes stop_codon:yes gene_type:complete
VPLRVSWRHDKNLHHYHLLHYLLIHSAGRFFVSMTHQNC